MKLCDYGCGREAKHQFKNGKWCCENFSNKCPEARRNNVSTKGYKLEKFDKLEEVNSTVFCDNGCGQIAKFITKTGKKYCCSAHQKCPVNRKKNTEGLIGNERQKGKNSKLFGRKRLEHSNFMKKNNPMFIKEYKQKLKDIVSSLEYKEKMSEIVFKRWKSKKYRKKISKIYLEKGIKYTDEQLGKKRSYYRKVFKYTKKSIEIHPEVMGDKIRGIGKNFYQLDHIYSIAEGFKNNIDPKMIGSIVNIQPLPCKENLLKKDSCWITLDELKRRYRTYENNF